MPDADGAGHAALYTKLDIHWDVDMQLHASLFNSDVSVRLPGDLTKN